MKGGGHGQENIDYLNSKKVDNQILWEYNNGVRRGNISIHKRGSHRTGDGQCWFPSSWTRDDIADAGRYVMSLKKNKKRENQIAKWGTYRRVRVGVKTNNGFISTIFPNYIQKGGIKQCPSMSSPRTPSKKK